MSAQPLTTAARTAQKPTFAQYAAIRRFMPTLAFSPDGREIAYSVNTSGQFNLWRQSTEGGWPTQITLSAGQAVRQIVWSPDGETIGFTADNDGDEFTKIYTIPATGGLPQEVAVTEQVQHFLCGWSPDGSQLAFAANDRVPTDQDVIVRDAATGDERTLMEGGVLEPLFWSPDGARMLVLDLKSNTDIDIHILDAATGASEHVTPHEGEVMYVPVGWAADGSGFWLVTTEGRESLSLAYQDLATGTRALVEAPDWEIVNAVVSRNGRWLVWEVNEDGYSRLYRRDLTQGIDSPAEAIPMPTGVLGTMALSDDGVKLGALFTQPTHPAEVFVIDMATQPLEPRQITQSALGGIDPATMVEPELIRYPTFDGQLIPAWLYRPHPDAIPEGGRGKAPVLLSIHGGPESQERPTYAYAGFYQYLASRGIAVLAPNVRGSTGYGKTYQTLIHHDWGGDELKDFEAAVQYLHAQDWVDADRIGVYGGSFGGFATLSCVSRLPNYWAAAVDLVGPSNLVTFAKAVPPTWRRMMAKWVGDPETEADFLMERSPITYVDQIVTPLFVIQGANDPRVVKPESDQIVAKLRDRGVEVRYDVYEDEGHGFTKRENEQKAFRDIAAFLEEHLLAPKG
ncbi:MAG: S9 family peptidase [Thermomicrobiales bacterium]